MGAARPVAATIAGIAAWLCGAGALASPRSDALAGADDRRAVAAGVAATLPVHAQVRATGSAAAGVLTTVDVRAAGGPWRSSAWDDLSTTALEPGRYELRLRVVDPEGSRSTDAPDAAVVQVPVCAGRSGARVDGRPIGEAAGPLVVPLGAGRRDHDVVIQVDVSRYERRIACGERPRYGATTGTNEGLGTLVFDSPHRDRGGGKAVVYVPPGHDLRAPGALLVGLHPWNGGTWTYGAYQELLREADARDVLLLMPSGLGNSLYTADAEDEVLRAIDALSSVVAVRPLDVSVWGASMGGAGATTIAFHHPDRFAAVTSFFGDSRYDRSTYVRSILVDERAAHAVNALDVVENARNLPVWLVHGEDDATSPILQSALLADSLRERGFAVRFDRVPGIGHSGALVARFVAQVVDRAATMHATAAPGRVSYRSVRPEDVGAYGVHIERAGGDAFVDVERRADGLHVLHAEGVRAIALDRGALGTGRQEPPALVLDDATAAGRVRLGWRDPSP
jgi:pimeloyl-ACP methyl ester carboxylesterase